MGVDAMVLGIVATVLGMIPFLFIIALPRGVSEHVLGIIAIITAQREGRPTGSAIAGVVLGVIGCIFSIIWWVAAHAVVTGAKNALEKGIAEPFKKAIEKAEE